jgi:hypothetical protein
VQHLHTRRIADHEDPPRAEQHGAVESISPAEATTSLSEATTSLYGTPSVSCASTRADPVAWGVETGRFTTVRAAFWRDQADAERRRASTARYSVPRERSFSGSGTSLPKPPCVSRSRRRARLPRNRSPTLRSAPSSARGADDVGLSRTLTSNTAAGRARASVDPSGCEDPRVDLVEVVLGYLRCSPGHHAADDASAVTVDSCARCSRDSPPSMGLGVKATLVEAVAEAAQVTGSPKPAPDNRRALPPSDGLRSHS